MEKRVFLPTPPGQRGQGAATAQSLDIINEGIKIATRQDHFHYTTTRAEICSATRLLDLSHFFFSAAAASDQGTTNLSCQSLAELYTPLVEGVDAPQEALHSHAVLVESEKLSHGEGVESRKQQRQGGSVARELAVRNEMCRHAFVHQVGHGLSHGEGVGLSEEVAHELVVVGQRFSRQRDRGGRSSEPNELRRHHTPLMDQLIERVLAISAWFSEDDLAAVEGQDRAIRADALAIALHIQLLDMRSEPPQRLSVGENGLSRVAQEGRVPQGEQTQQNGQVLTERSLEEVLVEVVCSSEELLHDRLAIVNGER
eukprot:scaffold14720_cov172-Ochromonas_danica.AAC.5